MCKSSQINHSRQPSYEEMLADVLKPFVLPEQNDTRKYRNDSLKNLAECLSRAGKEMRAMSKMQNDIVKTLGEAIDSLQNAHKLNSVRDVAGACGQAANFREVRDLKGHDGRKVDSMACGDGTVEMCNSLNGQSNRLRNAAIGALAQLAYQCMSDRKKDEKEQCEFGNDYVRRHCRAHEEDECETATAWAPEPEYPVFDYDTNVDEEEALDLDISLNLAVQQINIGNES